MPGWPGSLTVVRRAVALAAVLITGTALTASQALASPTGSVTIGSPQPELAAFGIGSTGGGRGSGAVLEDGTMVLASLSANGARALVCVLVPGGHSCASTATLSPYKGPGKKDAFSGVPEVLATGPEDVTVVLEDCCAIPVFSGLGGAVVFNSTNDAKTFSSEIPAGGIRGVDAATVSDGQIVLASSETSSLDVQALLPPPYVALSLPAHPNTRPDGDTSLSSYDGGVLVASDDARGDTLVEYTPKGSDFNFTSSYSPVGIFDGEDLAGVSADALLTYSSTATPGAFLRFFNGKTFGPPYAVPEPTGGGEAYWSLQSVTGLVHVFFLDKNEGSQLYCETTADGTHWSGLAALNPAPTAGGIAPVLESSGAGIVYETDATSGPSLVQPVLNGQTVTITLARLRAPMGKRTTVTGQVSTPLSGQLVTLERRISSDRWANIFNTHESAAGKFSFTVPGVTDTYRVMVADEPGSYQFGYSNAVTLTAVAPAKAATSS